MCGFRTSQHVVAGYLNPESVPRFAAVSGTAVHATSSNSTGQDANIIHCDLKPENILLAPPKAPPKAPPPQTPPAAGTAEQLTKKSKQDSDSDDRRRGSTGDVGGSGKHPREPPSLVLSSSGADRHADSLASRSERDDSVEKEQAEVAAAAAAAASAEQQRTADAQKQNGGGLGVWSDVKVIDLGSACFEGKTMYSYIQSRFCKSLRSDSDSSSGSSSAGVRVRG